MRLSENDKVDNVWLYQTGQERTITYRDKELVLNKLKAGNRDTKGVKVRV